MGTNRYIVAIEIGSSKVSGAVGMDTYDGIKIVAYASEPVNGFISKGVVRNVDETGNCLTSIINRMEAQMTNVCIEKAYVAFGGLSLHSIKSTVTKGFDEYTKIVPGIIDEMTAENDNIFSAPTGYQKVKVIPQECKLNGEVVLSPIGIPTKHIECNFLNLVIKEQYLKQLEESFNMSNIAIMDAFNATGIEAGIMLSDDDRRNGCALVNIGSETTTVAIYSNSLLRNLVVIPLGSENITRDLCAENISHQEAEQLKIFKGYASESNENDSIPTKTIDSIISARVMEILQNVKYRIEHSKEVVNSIIFTGGGAKLKNIETLLNENLAGYKLRILTDISVNYHVDENLFLTKDAITPTLYGLLKIGKENCCREEIIAPATETSIPESLFANVEEKNPELPEEKEAVVPEPKKTKKSSKSNGGGNFFGGLFDNLTKKGREFVNNITEEEAEDEEDN